MRILAGTLASLALVLCWESGTAKAVDTATTDTSTTTTTTTETAPQAEPSAEGNAAVKAPHPVNAGPLAAGANSFTEGQARKHIQHSGFTQVTNLTKDANGVWHGQAMRDGQIHNVSLDFKGNVVTN